jgi:phage terminase small subunit
VPPVAKCAGGFFLIVGLMAKKKLTAKQAAFCREYMIDRNATQAAIRAGYSEKTAYSVGHENLSKPEIAAEIRKLEKEAAERNRVSIDEVVQFLAETMRSDINEFVEAGPFGITLRDLEEIEPEKRKLIQKVSFKKGQGIDFQLTDKMSAAEKLMKHLGGYEADNSQKSGIIISYDYGDETRTED